MGIGAALAGTAALGGIGSIVSGIIGSGAAQGAASTQANASLAALADIQALLKPFVGAGTSALGNLQALTGTTPGGNPLTAALTAPFQPTMQQLAQTPGYQFTLQQGEQAITGNYAGTGLAGGTQGIGTGSPITTVSGPLGKALTSFAQGTATQTYQQQFSNYLAQNQQIYNMLAGQVGTGESAAAGVGSATGSLVPAAGQALASGTIGSANAISGAVGGATSAGSNAALLLALANSGMFTPAGSTATGPGQGG